MKKDRMWEALRFVIAGGFGFVFELGVMWVLKDVCGINTLVATPIAFALAVTLNYFLCNYWVFRGAKTQNGKKAVAFLLTSLIGLALNELFMWLFRLLLGEESVLFVLFGFTVKMYLLNKAIASVLVMVWNYFTKKRIIRS